MWVASFCELTRMSAVAVVTTGCPLLAKLHFRSALSMEAQYPGLADAALMQFLDAAELEHALIELESSDEVTTDS